MKRSNLIFILIATLLSAVVSPSADARVWPFKGKKKAESVQKDTTVKKTPYDKLLGKGTESARGFMTLHLKNGKVYLEVPDSVLGKELVLGATVASTSDNGAGPVGQGGA